MENNGIEWNKMELGAYCTIRINGGNRKLGGKMEKIRKIGEIWKKCVTGNFKKVILELLLRELKMGNFLIKWD